MRLDASIVAAIEAGRAIIVPDRHRAAALRLAWARNRLAAGRTVWASPAILTWEAWLAEQWRAAVQRGEAPPEQLLSGGQERELWEQILRQAAPRDADTALWTIHADGLARAAARATQWLLPLAATSLTDEEHLLVDMLAAFRAHCARRGLRCLPVTLPAELGFLAAAAPPAIVGQPRLTPLQQTLQEQCWPGAGLLLAEPPPGSREPALRRFGTLEAELSACAAWCLARLREDGHARLLVLTACAEPPLASQAALLWRGLAPGRAAAGEEQARLLAVEAAAPLRHQGLIADALDALELAADELDTAKLLALLASPWFDFGTPAETMTLRRRLAEPGLATLPAATLRQRLAAIGQREPAAARLLAWLGLLRERCGAGTRRPATGWADRFSECLLAARFATGSLDSRDAQRLARWAELLDEFAGLDALLAPMEAGEALGRLARLARRARHEAASADAAITFSDVLGDPVADYDGIWMLGLAETRWPAPPRPDPYVALPEQRRCRWPEAGVGERREQALWALSRWRRRTGELVLSFAELEADLRHRPTSLLAVSADAWQPGVDAPRKPHATAARAEPADARLPALDAGAEDSPLPGGASRLSAQQDCPFRAQAQWRLEAKPPPRLADGIPATLRGSLLHRLLKLLWDEIGDQQHLLALSGEAEREAIGRAWDAAVRELAAAGSALLPRPVLERERARARRIVAALLELERQRAPFEVESRERTIQWHGEGTALRFTVDRVDRSGGERVLIDYKSGATDRMRLLDARPEPLQLALYATALAQAGEPVSAAVLLRLAPGAVGFAGESAREGLVPLGRKRPVEAWEKLGQAWRSRVLELLGEHLSGAADLAVSEEACRYCHLPALCRRGAIDTADAADE